MSEAKEFSVYFVLKKGLDYKKIGIELLDYFEKNNFVFEKRNNSTQSTLNSLTKTLFGFDYQGISSSIHLNSEKGILHLFSYDSKLTDDAITIRDSSWKKFYSIVESIILSFGNKLDFVVGSFETQMDSILLQTNFPNSIELKEIFRFPFWCCYLDNNLIKEFGSNKIENAPFWKREKTSFGSFLLTGLTPPSGGSNKNAQKVVEYFISIDSGVI